MRNVFNADESALYYRRTPKITIGPGSLPGRKMRKDRVSVLFCCNATGNERMPPFVIGRSTRPRWFSGASGGELGLGYSANPRGWMNLELFFSWLHRFNNKIAEESESKVCLLLDIASCHGKHTDLPILSNVTVKLLPKKATSILQTLDSGVIAAIKKRYMRRQIERGVDRIDKGHVNDVYNVDLKLALEWLYEIWTELSDELIRNCWVKTQICE